MSSPAKKRKLNNGSKSANGASKGLEFFFNKQKQSVPTDTLQQQPVAAARDQELTDEQLARKLQDEWNQEETSNADADQSGGVLEAEKQAATAASNPVAPTEQSNAGLGVGNESPATASGQKKTLTLQCAGLAEDSITSTIPFDESPLQFDPSKYAGELQTAWSGEGGDATYALLTRCFVLVSATASRIKIVDTLVNCLRLLIETDPSSLLPAVWLATNSISPPYISLELGLGGSAISKALKQVCGLDSRSLKAIYDKYGDAGDVAFEAKKKQSFTLRKPKPLTIKGVYQSLVKIANSQGHGSGEAKQRLVDRLLQDARGVRSPKDLAKLRKEELAEVWSRPEEIVKACFAKRPNYNDLIPVLLEIGVCEELLGRDFACEFKYDGQRAQIHCDDEGKVSIFSRHLELMTDKYPDLVEMVPKIRGDGVRSFILEGEVVAVDRVTGELKPFQTLANRARKDVAIGSIAIDVCLFSFDLMYLNGQPLLDRPFRERRELLRSLFVEIPHHFTWVQSLDATSSESETVLDFFKQATDVKCEGIMVKILDNLEAVPHMGNGDDSTKDTPSTPKSKARAKSKVKGSADDGEERKSRRKPLLATYEPDKRLDSWLKVKKDYNSNFDTLDMIPVAGWHGQGRKAKWWSPILMAVRNEDTGSLEVVTKCMSGFTDAFYKANKEFYDNGEESVEMRNTHVQKPSFVEYSGPSPDIWFEPQEVWEMAFADITLSPTYTAAIGLVSDERGLSMRFPRFLKKREDKGVDEASTNEFLASLWRKQEAKAVANGATEGPKDDVEDEP
ncbi:DNA ligase-like protein [Emericellopsis cladophorae]|uniref:DNA ligase-like protein n=1 Tax=Emericellopsis cladophorae TaxID=2686198 RepID=A0A9P9XY16_9HYPO|nr:DNA ligase-like protein [Emericellopsis cladophorae]KAI6779968.1 DNA ligase-like protein [Emericellopsis cladophorae]